jgi:RNA polymerase sigma factor (sigma-70 family)
MNQDGELLRRYASDHSEAAFAELVARHIDLVYSAALRQTQGDVHEARDITQVVSTDLARKARALKGHTSLVAWLHTSTRYAAAARRRTDTRRRSREQAAYAMNDLQNDSSFGADWERLREVVDEALHELRTEDREAVLLRFFQNKALKEVGAALSLCDLKRGRFGGGLRAAWGDGRADRARING